MKCFGFHVVEPGKLSEVVSVLKERGFVETDGSANGDSGRANGVSAEEKTWDYLRWNEKNFASAVEKRQSTT